MPALKTSAAARSSSRESQRRTWGTRYDTLLSAVESSQGLSSPPISPVSSPISSAEESVQDVDNVRSRGEQSTDSRAQCERKRDWADDEVPHVLATPNGSFTGVTFPSRVDPNGGLSSATALDGPRKEGTKLPHNASVFVGR